MDTSSAVWAVTNVVATLMLPPASLLALIGAGLWLGRTRRWARWLAGLALLALTLLSIPLVGVLLSGPFETAYPPLDLESLQNRPSERVMVVVLGGGRELGALEYPERERVSNASLRRARYAARIAGASRLRLAISGGKPTGGAYSEAALMKRFVEDELKQPVALIEERSFDTRQNAQLIQQGLRALGVTDIVLVTDVTHMPRAARTFRSTGLNVIPAPIRFYAQAPLNVTDFLPSADGLEKSHRALREMLGELWYWARGRL